MRVLPTKMFFTDGVGRHKEKLESFDLALKDAGIEKFNLVTVSSILPSNCEIIDKKTGLKELKPGEVLFCVMSRNESNEPHRRISASIGCAKPASSTEFGFISEHHTFGEMTEKKCGEYSEKLASSMYRMRTDSEPKETFNKSKSAIVSEDGLWTTVISAAVMICGL